MYLLDHFLQLWYEDLAVDLDLGHLLHLEPVHPVVLLTNLPKTMSKYKNKKIF